MRLLPGTQATHRKISLRLSSFSDFSWKSTTIKVHFKNRGPAVNLRQHFPDGLDADIGQRHGPAAHLILLLVIEAERLKNRGENLARANLAFGDRVSVRVAGTIDRAAANSAASDRHAPSRSEMIAAQ